MMETEIEESAPPHDSRAAGGRLHQACSDCPPVWWAIRVTGKYEAEILEAEDLMRALNEPGDACWMQPRGDPDFGGRQWIAQFEDLAKTREEAIKIWVNRLTRERDAINAGLAKWDHPNDKNPATGSK